MNEIIIYQTQSGSLELKNDYSNQTIWANRMQMAEIFDVNTQAISKHIQNIYKDNELDKHSTSSKMELVQMESEREVKRNVDYYNLEMIISVGYRINTVKGTKFRQWATQTLKQHITKGYTINQKRLEENKAQFLLTLENLKTFTSEINLYQYERNNLLSRS